MQTEEPRRYLKRRIVISDLEFDVTVLRPSLWYAPLPRADQYAPWHLANIIAGGKDMPSRMRSVEFVGRQHTEVPIPLDGQNSAILLLG